MTILHYYTEVQIMQHVISDMQIVNLNFFRTSELSCINGTMQT